MRAMRVAGGAKTFGCGRCVGKLSLLCRNRTLGMVAQGASSVSTRLSRPIWPRGIFPSPNANRSDSAHALVLLDLLALLALFLARPKAMPRAKLTRFACNANLRALPPSSTETGQRSMAGIFVRPLHLLCSAPRIGAALRTLRSKDFLVLPTGPGEFPWAVVFAQESGARGGVNIRSSALPWLSNCVLDRLHRPCALGPRLCGADAEPNQGVRAAIRDGDTLV